MLSAINAKITPSVTVGINAKVMEMKKQGKDIINFSIGEPDFYTPDVVKEAAVKALEANKTKYDKESGLVELREAIAEKLKAENGLDYKINEIVVSNGAKQSITNTCIALLDQGDEVMIPAPYWVSYPEIVKITGGVPLIVATSRENDFKITAEEIEANATEKTKMIILTNPSNPLGIVYTGEELRRIAEVCVRRNIYILADEIYERICFDDEFVSIASLSPEAKEITITVNGMSKSIPMTGWRIGYTACNQKLASAMSSIQGHLTSHPCTISQWAAVAALKECGENTKAMVEIYRQRRDFAVEYLATLPTLSVVNPKGAFYIFIDVSEYKSAIKWEDSFSVAFCEGLLTEGGVAAVPGAAFGADDYIRISYACEMPVLKEGLERLGRFINTLR